MEDSKDTTAVEQVAGDLEALNLGSTKEGNE